MGFKLLQFRFLAAAALFLAVALLLAGCSPAAPPAEPRISAVRILPFEVEGPVDQPDFVGRALAESLARNLETVADLRVLDLSAPSGAETLTLAGRLERSEERSCIELRALAAGSDEPLWTVHPCSESGAVPELIAGLTEGCREALGRERPQLYPYITQVRGDEALAASPLPDEAWRHFSAGRIPEFERATAELVAEFPDDPSAHVLHGWGLTLTWDAEPTAEALALLRDRLDALDRVDPDSPYDELFQAYVYRASGAPDEARALYARVLERNDLTPAARSWILRQRSYTYLQAGQNEAARRDAGEAVQLDPANPLTLVALSKALEATGELDDAFARASEAVALQPDSWRHLQRVGIVSMRAGNGDLAVHYLERACEMSGKQEACGNLSVALQRSGQPERARDMAARAEALTPSRWGEYNIACYWTLKNDRPAALAALRKAVELGFADVQITTDPDLDGLRGGPQFEAVVEDVLDRIRARRGIATAVFPWQA